VTVTYVTAPASFLATRCLNQLASEEASSYPLAVEVISRDMYIEDLSGSNNLSEAQKLQEEIIHILGLTQISWKVYQNSYENVKFLVTSRTMKASKLWDWCGTPHRTHLNMR